mmetsp:Transcript_39446/g.92257  ORF Transcript_39446/g.92257 Transcript_39446/m.92257 type:complete len:217 (-) Transcript_39446:1831-2481(-)
MSPSRMTSCADCLTMVSMSTFRAYRGTGVGVSWTCIVEMSRHLHDGHSSVTWYLRSSSRDPSGSRSFGGVRPMAEWSVSAMTTTTLDRSGAETAYAIASPPWLWRCRVVTGSQIRHHVPLRYRSSDTAVRIRAPACCISSISLSPSFSKLISKPFAHGSVMAVINGTDANLPVWWFGQADTWAPRHRGGYMMESPASIRALETGSVLSLVQDWGQK